MKIKKGDRVVVLQGKDRGKQGVVMRALPSQGKVIVEGVNIAKKHQKPTRQTMQGGIIDKDMQAVGYCLLSTFGREEQQVCSEVDIELRCRTASLNVDHVHYGRLNAP